LAEAEARVNGVNARAVDLLNAVRTRSKGTAYTAADFADGAALAAAILKERRIELMGEGLRSFDLMRLLLPIPGKGNVGEVTPDNSDYIWPMPSGELAVNKLCQRNP
jgi:starch-binding outer membrane protein, SusD/RagB family